MFERAGERGQRSVFKGALFGVFAVGLGGPGLRAAREVWDGWRKMEKAKSQDQKITAPKMMLLRGALNTPFLSFLGVTASLFNVLASAFDPGPMPRYAKPAVGWLHASRLQPALL